MALTNCTITESSLTKVGGSQIGSDNVQLVITPNSGYVVSAAAFTNNTGTLAGVSSISFSNSGTANTIGNTVLVAVDLTDTFVMPSANTTLTIDIDGAAVLRSYSLTGSFTTQEANTTTSSGTTNYSATGNFGQQVTVFTKTFTADTGHFFGEHNIKGALINIISQDNNDRTLVTSSNTLDSSGRIVSCTFTVKYTFPNEDISGHQIAFVALAEAFFVPVVEITSYNIITTNIDPVGATRSMSVYGTPTATFSLAVTNEDSTSIHSISNLTIGATGKQQFDITFPTVTDSDIYNFVLTGSNVSTNFGGSGEQAHTFSIPQNLPIVLQAGLHYAANAPSGVSISANKSITLQANSVNFDFDNLENDIGNTFTITRAAGLQIDTAAGNMSQFTNLAPQSNGGTVFGPDASQFTDTAGFGRFESLTFTATNATTVSAVLVGTVEVSGGSNVTSLFNLESYISAGNTAPVANNVSISVNKGAGTLATLNATDADSDSLTYTIVSVPSQGSLFTDSGKGTAVNAGTTLAAATVYYEHNNSTNFSDSFTYKANDGTVDSNTATVNAAVGVSAGSSLSTSGDAGIYIVPIVVGTSAGTLRVHCDALTVPDRFELLFATGDPSVGNPNVHTDSSILTVSNSRFVGDGVNSTTPANGTTTGLNKYEYVGSGGNATGSGEPGAAWNKTATNQSVLVQDTDVVSDSGQRTDLTPNGPARNSASANQFGLQNKVTTNGSGGTALGLDYHDGNVAMRFTKATTTNAYVAFVKVTGVDSSTAWNIHATSFDSLTSFQSSTVQTSANACTASLGETYFHNGTNTLPVVGDHVYANVNASAVLAQGFYRLNNSTKMNVSANGLVYQITTC